MKVLTFLYISFFSVNALAMAMVTGLTGVDWNNFTKTQQFVVGAAIIGTWSNTMLALIVTLTKREAAGKPLVPTDGTQFIDKSQIDKPKET